MKSDWHLLDERDFLVRSLEDASSEHAAGDLDDGDYSLLRARDEQRLAEVERELARDEAAPAVEAEPARRFRFVRWRRRWWLAAGGVALLVAAAVLLAFQLTSPRLPGETATGSIDLNSAQKVEQQLAQAGTLVKEGKDVEALEVYGDVISADPRDATALAEWGWLDWQAAEKAKEPTVAAEGASALEQAVTLDPGLYAAQYYLGSILLQEGDPGKAVAHFAKFLADHPTSKWRHDAAPEIRAANAAVHRRA